MPTLLTPRPPPLMCIAPTPDPPLPSRLSLAVCPILSFPALGAALCPPLSPAPHSFSGSQGPDLAAVHPARWLVGHPSRAPGWHRPRDLQRHRPCRSHPGSRYPKRTVGNAPASQPALPPPQQRPSSRAGARRAFSRLFDQPPAYPPTQQPLPPATTTLHAGKDIRLADPSTTASSNFVAVHIPDLALHTFPTMTQPASVAPVFEPAPRPPGGGSRLASAFAGALRWQNHWPTTSAGAVRKRLLVLHSSIACAASPTRPCLSATPHLADTFCLPLLLAGHASTHWSPTATRLSGP